MTALRRGLIPMPSRTSEVRALLDEAQANGIRDNTLRGIVAALCVAVTMLCDELDATAGPGVFVPDDFLLAEPPVGAE